MNSTVKLIIQIIQLFCLFCFTKITNISLNNLIAHVLKNIFINLGPAGIKIGQVLSHRTDIIPKDICVILSDLTDNVPGLSKKEEQILLDYAREKIDYNIKPIQIGAGCISVTYKTNYNNDIIVIKIKRPNIDYEIKKSMNYLAYLSQLFKLFTNIDFKDKIKKIDLLLSNQTNFHKELNELIYFYMTYNNKLNLVIPKPYSELSDNIILVQQFIPGVHISDIEENDKLFVLKTLWNFGFKSAFIDGRWHGDLHKGNIIIDKNKKYIGIIDFGITGELKHFQRSILINYNNFLIKKDWRNASKIFVNKMIDKKIYDTNTKLIFIDEISIILKTYLDRESLDFITLIGELSECSKKYNTSFNNNFVQFELAFATLTSTITELGQSNIFNYINQASINLTF